jgi:ribonuclease-3 family protein
MEKSVEDTTSNKSLEDEIVETVTVEKEAVENEESNLLDEDENFEENEEIQIHEDELDLIKHIKLKMNLPETDIRTYSPLALAFIGDGVYDLVIRTMIVEQGNAPVNKLHKKVSNLVKAPAQMELFHKIEERLTEGEIAVYKRGRNAKSFTTAKNASITEYRIATGLEALIGYLYLTNQFTRILELIKMGLE